MTVQACRLAGAEAKGRAQGPGRERSRKKLWEKPRAWRGAARQAKVMFRGPGRSNRGLEGLGNGLNGTGLVGGVEKCVCLVRRGGGGPLEASTIK